MGRINIVELTKKYRYVLIVLLVGILLMLVPLPGAEEEPPAAQQTQAPDLETRLTEILSRIAGAGKVAVMLTEASGEEIIYQTDGDGGDTVLVTDASRNQQGLIRSRYPPVFRGAIVVCTGADSPAVRLAIVEAVSNVTGLGSDKITVLKMG